MKRFFAQAIFAGWIACGSFYLSAKAADWNQWRGPMRDGMVSEGDWPEKLSGHQSSLGKASFPELQRASDSQRTSLHH